MGSFIDSEGKNIESMGEYWINSIRNDLDAVRKYVSNPALYNEFDTLDASLVILDAGCGEGYLTRELTNRGHHVIGIDESSYLIKAAKEASVGPEEYILADVNNLPVADGLIDAVISNFLMIELENPHQFIAEASRVLNQHGRLIIQTIHPSLFISKTGQAEGKIVEDYHVSQAQALPIINFDPNSADQHETPEPIVWYHHSLETYVTPLVDNGFYIRGIKEPSPIGLTPRDHEVRKLLKDPRIILIDAEKMNNTGVQYEM